MTLRLILTRHAKSAWDDPFADDHERVLNARGRQSAIAIGTWLQANGYLPEHVLCSDAARTVETWEVIAAALLDSPPASIRENLYLAGTSGLLSALRGAPTGTVMVIAHNPGIGMLASALVASAPSHTRFMDYPTAATTIIDFDVASWADIKVNTGQCVDFIVPRDLLDVQS